MLFTVRQYRGPQEPLDWLPVPLGATAWLRRGDGILGWGSAATLNPKGRSRFAEAQDWWDDLTGNAVIDDTSNIRNNGPIALVKLSYADDSTESTLIVPQVLHGRRRDDGWITTVGHPPPATPVPVPVTAPVDLRYGPGSITRDAHRRAVAAATALIRTGRLDKVVLGRDLVVESSTLLDQRWILTRLARLFPSCWVFAVDGLIGASPELLLRVTRDRFEMLVLAGTSWPAGDTTATSSNESLASFKNRNEHAFAVESAVESLAPLSSWMEAAETPSILQLPNVAHLASRIRGRLRTPAPAPLALLERLHPTAAVCGTPRDAAQQAIDSLELMDRGGYLGPVGWLDAHGNAEFAIALRCAQVDTTSARLFAGGGIVAESSPDQENAEVDAKFAAFQSALAEP